MLLCLGTTPTIQRSMFFDRVTVDEVNRAAEVRDYASGKAINVARVAHQIGMPVIATGFVGAERGDFFLRELDRDGLRHDFVQVSSSLRTCTTVVDRAAGTATELVEESAAIEPEKWSLLLERIASLGSAASFWVLSGSLPPKAPQDFYARCIELARRAGKPVLLDTRGDPLREALSQPSFIAKLNCEELASTVGHPLTDEASIQESMRKVRPKDGTIVVTLGSKGALVFDGETCWRVTPPRVRAVSAVGSGDAFSAGLAVATVKGRAMPDALRLAAACGAANAITPWAGFVNPGDVDALEKQTIVETIRK